MHRPCLTYSVASPPADVEETGEPREEPCEHTQKHIFLLYVHLPIFTLHPTLHIILQLSIRKSSGHHILPPEHVKNCFYSNCCSCCPMRKSNTLKLFLSCSGYMSSQMPMIGSCYCDWERAFAVHPHSSINQCLGLNESNANILKISEVCYVILLEIY